MKEPETTRHIEERPKLLDVLELSKEVNLPPSWLLRKARLCKDPLPAVRCGKYWRFRHAHVSHEHIKATDGHGGL